MSHLMCSPVAGAHFCPFPASQQGNLYLRFWDLGALLSNYAIKKALEDLMNYAHSDFQSFPLSHHKVTRTRSHYYSVNSMPLSWDVSAFFSHALYSRSVLHGRGWGQHSALYNNRKVINMDAFLSEFKFTLLAKETLH